MHGGTQSVGVPFPIAAFGAAVQRQRVGSDSPHVEWVRRAQTGDVDAFELLFNQYQRAVYNLVYQMVRSDADASDITQEAFMRAWKALPRLEQPEAFVSWLFRIATNLTRNWVRDRGRVQIESLDQPVATDDGDGTAREIPDFSADPAAIVQQSELRDVVTRAVSTLSDDHRVVVTLHHLEGLGVEEIAGIMRCSVGTVKSRLARAREHLRRKLGSFVER